MVYIEPGVYRLEGEVTTEAFNISKDTYFVAKLVEYEVNSQGHEDYRTEENGHWFIPNVDTYLDLEWKNCDFETMAPLSPVGVDDGRHYIVTDGYSFLLRGIKRSNGTYSLEIKCRVVAQKKNIIYTFQQDV